MADTGGSTVMTKIFLLGLTAALTYCSVAEAERPVLNVYYVRSPRAISLETLSQANKVIKATMRHDFKRKVKIRVRGIDESKSFIFNDSLNEFYHYYNHYHVRLTTGRKKWALVISPPEIDKNGIAWMTGRGQTQCWRKVNGLTLAMVNMAEVNSFGAPRILHSIFGALHELGHTLSLQHVEDTGSIMNTAVLYWVSYGVSFSEAERFKGKHCLRAKK